MANQIASTILVGISAIKAAAALTSWYDERKQNRGNSFATTPNGTPVHPSRLASTEYVDKLFFVMSTLGQRLLALDAIHRDLLPEVCQDVQRAFSRSSMVLSSTFDELEEVMQATVASAVAFCAACHPMHIYRGFGCGVLNDSKWANPATKDRIDSDILLDMDATISYYKSLPQEFRFFRKSPSRISRTRPSYVKTSKADRLNYISDIYSLYEKKGFPQPKDENLRINTWHIPFATWNGKAMYDNQGHSVEDTIRWQLDPGRFLYAWTIGERLDLCPGEAVIPLQEHIGYLAEWLQDHRGMTFTVLYDHDLNDQNKYSYSIRRSLQASMGNPRGNSGKVAAIVCDPRKLDDRDAQDGSMPEQSSRNYMTKPETRSQYLSVPSPMSRSLTRFSRSPSLSTTATSPPPLYTANSNDSISLTSSSIKRRPVSECPPTPPPRPITINSSKPDDFPELEFLTAEEMV